VWGGRKKRLNTEDTEGGAQRTQRGRKELDCPNREEGKQEGGGREGGLERRAEGKGRKDKTLGERRGTYGKLVGHRRGG